MRECFFFFMFSYDAKPHKAKPNAADYTDFGSEIFIDSAGGG